MSRLKKIPEISPTFCVYPWMEFLLGPTKHARACCVFETSIKDENQQPYSFDKTSLSSYWNGYGLKQIRKAMLEGKKVKGCSHCYYQESIGENSYRKSCNKEWFSSEQGEEILNRVKKSQTNDYFVEEQPLYLDIRPGNLCNLKCRMCNPGSSSKIYQEQKKMLSTKSATATALLDDNYFNADEKQFHNWYKDKKIWETVYKWAPKVKRIYFTGGEPTLIKENWALIDYLKREGHSKNIELVFNINCTQIPEKLLDTFHSFAKCTMTFSIDGLHQVQEYIRSPSKWNEVQSNILKVLEHKTEKAEFFFSPVVQVYNILHLIDLCKWIENLNSSHKNLGTSFLLCTTPRFLDIDILPNSIKKEALSRIQNYLKSYKKNDFLVQTLKSVENVLKKDETPSINKDLKNFFAYTKLLDNQRSEHFESVFPELNRMLDEDGRWKS